MQKLPIIIQTSESNSQQQQQRQNSLNNSYKRRSTRKLAEEAHENSNMDSYGNTNIEIKLSDSNTKLNSKKFANSTNADTNKDVNTTNKADLTDNDDINTPFTNDTNQANSDDKLKTTNNRAASKNIFRSIFCCFKTSHGPSHSKRSKSSASRKSNKDKKSSYDLNDGTSAHPNLTNLQNLSINNNNENNNNDATGSEHNDSNVDNISVEENSKNAHNYNGNNFNNNDLNNGNGNSLYNNGQPNYFQNGNDNINLNNIEKPLLEPLKKSSGDKKCLIIDLDETLVHSSFKQVSNADFIVPVEIDGIVHQVYVLKRPHVDEFLKKMGKLFECVLFTASLAKYADPVADLLDKSKVFKARLFREACVYYRGNYVKDLSRLGRDLNKVIIIDNSPASYIFHPDNAVACNSWFDDPNDTQLLELIPYFEKLAACDSVYSILKQGSSVNSVNSTLNHSINGNQNNNNYYQQQSIIYSQQKNNDEHQQVPSQQMQSLIYQQQQQQENLNSPDYSLNENKILLSIDMMMAKKQQQLQ